MLDPFEQFKAVLKQHRQSLTRSRQIIFQALQDKEPQTMTEIVAACQSRVDRASVYRTISLFEHLGIVQRLQIGWKYKLELSDTFHRHHHHLTCRQCGTTFALSEDFQLERLLEAVAAAQGFMMQDHQLEMQGVCRACQVSTKML